MVLFSGFESSAGFVYIQYLQQQLAQSILYTTLVCFLGSGLSFGDEKCCSKVRSGFVAVLMLCRFSNLFRGSVEAVNVREGQQLL